MSDLTTPRAEVSARLASTLRRLAVDVRATTLTALVLGSLTTLPGCGPSLPDQGLILTVRPLAVRVDVTTPLVPETDPDAAPRAQALPFEGVTLTPFVVGPEGPVDVATLDPLWIACASGPSQVPPQCILEAAASADSPRRVEDLPACETPSFDDFDPDAIPTPQGLCRLAGSATAAFTVPLDTNILSGGSVEVTLITGVPGGTSTKECAETLLSGDPQVPEDCVLVASRVRIGPLERLYALATDFGLELPPGVEIPPEDEIPDFDRHPRITRFEVGEIPESLEPALALTAVERGGVVSVSELDTLLRIEAEAPESDLQTYPVPSSGGPPGERTEAFDGAWLRTWGSLLAGGSEDPASFNEYTYAQGGRDEVEMPPGGRAAVYFVLRDGRGGVDWWWFFVEQAP
jgi:hypothetical protein